MTPANAEEQRSQDDPRQHFARIAARRRRKVATDILRGVLAARGPSWAVQLLFLKLWQLRDDKPEPGKHKGWGIVETNQATLLADFGDRDQSDRGIVITPIGGS